MTTRNSELANLLVVGVLTGLGFASVYIARQSVISTGSISYALIFLGLYLIAHVVTRFTVPWADPYLLPLSGLLAAIGVTEIYRLGPTDAFRQGFWIVVGVGVFALTLVLLRDDFRVLENYKYLFGVSAVGLLMLPALPVIGERINGARLWVKLGPLQFQPGELAKIALIVFLAGYLREKREVLAQGRLKDFGPLLAIWGAAMLVLVETNDLGERAPLLRDLRRDALRRHRARRLRRGSASGCSSRAPPLAYTAIPRVQERMDCWLAPVGRRARELLPDRAGDLLDRERRLPAGRASAAAPSRPRAAPT